MSIQNSTTYDYILTRGNSTNFANLPAIDGKIRFVIDKEELYVDYSNKHIRVSDIVIDYTESEIRALTNFSNNKIYIASDNKKMLMYNDILGAWEDIMTKHTHPLSQITDAGTAAAYNVPESGDAGNNQVVLGSDTRLIKEIVNGYYNEANDKFYKESTYITEIPGEANKIYIDFNYNRIYRWTGTGFIPLSATSDLELGTSHDNAYYGDYGNIAYEHATENARYTTSTAVGLYKVGSTEEGHISGLTAIEKADITGLGIPAQDTTYDVVTQSVDGLMSAEDKEKLDNINIVSANIDATNHVLHLNGDDLIGLEGKVDKTSVGAANGVASLDENGKVPSSQLPGSISGTLAGLDDVNIVTPTDGQVLTYDVSNSVWINSDATGGSGGHTIEDSTGTDMTQRTNLQFIDANVIDDSTNDRTKIENIQVISDEDDLDDAPDGIYIGSYDESSSILSASIVSYNNTTSELLSTNVQDAIDEVTTKVDALSSAYHHAGTKTCSELVSSLLVSTNEGNVYNITDSGETTSDFIEGAGKSIRVGDNVGVAKIGTDTYKFDLLSGFIDTSNFADKVTSATNGNLAGLNASGNLTDSGIAASDITDIQDKMDETTTSISGNPISIADLKSAQIALNPVITFEPIQAGSGTPSPSNIRAISGYDKIEVSSCGKNLFNKDDATSIIKGYISSTIVAGDAMRTVFVKCKPSTTYTVSKTAGQRFTVAYTKELPAVGVTVYGATGNNTASSITITVGADAKYVVGYVFNSSNDSGTADQMIASVQIEENNQATTYEPYHKTTDLSESLGQTVYGGTLDVRTGVLTVDRGIVDLGSLNWMYTGSLFYSDSDIGAYIGEGKIWDCSVYKGINNVEGSTAAADNPNFTICGYSDLVSPAQRIYIKDSNQNSVEGLKTYLNGIIGVYELATPYTIQLTPHEIALSQGYNYISTNGTSISLAYHNGEMASLGDVSQIGNTLNNLGSFLSDNKFNIGIGLPSGNVNLSIIQANFKSPGIAMHYIAESDWEGWSTIIGILNSTTVRSFIIISRRRIIYSYTTNNGTSWTTQTLVTAT